MVRKRTIGELIFDGFNYFFLIIVSIIALYPILYVAFASISDPIALMRFRGILVRPLGVTLDSYRLVLSNPLIRSGYINTIIIVVFGTLLNVLMTAFAAYGLSRKKLYLKNFIIFMITFTMFFSGGLIPSYLLIRMTLGLKDNLLALILPGAMSAYNMIIMRTSFLSLPDSMEESAKLDGANDFIILFMIILPLSLPVVMVMVLYYGVAHWNSWFSAMLYIDTRSKFPLQLVLREILVANSTSEMTTSVAMEEKAFVGETIKYSTIIIATLPILSVYPFLQRFFVKGVMIGAIKE